MPLDNFFCEHKLSVSYRLWSRLCVFQVGLSLGFFFQDLPFFFDFVCKSWVVTKEVR